MTDPRKKKREPDPPAEAGDENERPTVNPPFDVEAFAREASGPSSGRRHSTEAPTQAPPPAPVPNVEIEPESRAQQITLTNEAELEQARVASTQRSEPPKSALSIADARSPSSPSVPAAPGSVRSLSPTSIEAAVLGAIGASPAPEITERTIDDPLAEMSERFSLGDYTGALEMSELILAEDPGNLEAAECGENCRSVLENMYAAKLGPLQKIPLVLVPRTQMRWLSMDQTGPASSCRSSTAPRASR